MNAQSLLNTYYHIAPILLIGFLLFITKACKDSRSPDTLSTSAEELLTPSVSSALSQVNDPYSQDPVVRKSEGKLIEMANKFPAFGGFYFDSQQELHMRDDNIVVLIKDLNNADRDKAAEIVLSIINRDIGKGVNFTKRDIVFKDAAYNFYQLQAYRDILMDRLGGIKGITAMDLAEDKNWIYVGVNSYYTAEKVERVVAQSPVPREAVKMNSVSKSPKWDPGIFNQLPDTAPFTLSSNITPKIIDDSTGHLQMEILMTNTSEDTIKVTTSMGAHGFAGPDGNVVKGPGEYFNFIVLCPDTTLIWRRLEPGFRALAQRVITLVPGQTHIFEEDWDLITRRDELVQEGTYYVYAGIESLGYTLPGPDESKRVDLGMTRTGSPDTLNVKWK